MLFRMIQQLQREVAEMRRVLQTQRGDRPPERDRPRAEVGPPPRGGNVGVPPRGWERSQAGKVFQAYDRNRDLQVTVEEWFAMKEGLGEGDSERKRLEASRFRQADPNSDGRMTVSEFLFWYTQGRYQQAREGGQPRGDRERRPESRREAPERERSSPRDREDAGR